MTEHLAKFLFFSLHFVRLSKIPLFFFCLVMPRDFVVRSLAGRPHAMNLASLTFTNL